MHFVWIVLQLAVCTAYNIILDNDTARNAFDIKYTVFGDLDLEAVFPSDFSNRFGALDATGFRVCRQPDSKVRHLNAEPTSEQLEDVEKATEVVAELKKTMDVGSAELDSYWTYMLTKAGLVQAHLLFGERQKIFVSQKYILGVPQEPHHFEHELREDGSLAIYEIWDNGTTCDLTLTPRKAKIKYVCDPRRTAPTIRGVAEVQSCVYEVIIALPQLCTLPAFLPMVRDRTTVECERFVRDLHVPNTDQLDIIELENIDWMLLFGRGVYLAQIKAYPRMVVVCTEGKSPDAMAYRVAEQVVRNLDKVPPPVWETQCSSDFAMAFDVYDINGLRMATVLLEPELRDNGFHAMPYSIIEEPFDTNYLMYNNRWTHLGLF